jgi:hypothetical protein
VKPIEQQGDWESRRLWEKVAKGIRSGNYDAAAQDKTRIEVSRKSARQMRRLMRFCAE